MNDLRSQSQKNDRHLVHCFDPIFDENSSILILGSLPSVMSVKNNFYYGHPKNRFWKLIAAVFNAAEPQSIDEKKHLLLDNGIALWDAIKECDIKGSSDASIKNIVPQDLTVIFNRCNIQKVYSNGKTAERIYNKYLFPVCKKMINALPSTSPANAAWSFERLLEHWSKALRN